MQEKITVFLIIILFITNLLRDYWGHYNFVTAISIPNNKEISSTGSVDRTTTCRETKSDFKLMWWSGTLWKPGSIPCYNLFAPAEVFSEKDKLFSNIKGKRKSFWLFDCTVLFDKDTGIMPKKQIVDVRCVTFICNHR